MYAKEITRDMELYINGDVYKPVDMPRLPGDVLSTFVCDNGCVCTFVCEPYDIIEDIHCYIWYTDGDSINDISHSVCKIDKITSNNTVWERPKPLKCCPFCGGEKITVLSKSNNVFANVVCDTCGAGGAQYLTRYEAIEAWNKRYKEV